MKKWILASVLFLSAPVMMTTTSSCSVLNGNTTGSAIQAVSKVANVAATANEIANVLGNTLGLNKGQKSSVLTIFTDYIGQTNAIASLFKSNKASYAEQLLGLNSGVMGKLNNVLTVAQYTKLLGLGGNGSSTGSLLNGLVGGKSMSGSAANVLGGLLLNGLK